MNNKKLLIWVLLLVSLSSVAYSASDYYDKLIFAYTFNESSGILNDYFSNATVPNYYGSTVGADVQYSQTGGNIQGNAILNTVDHVAGGVGHFRGNLSWCEYHKTAHNWTIAFRVGVHSQNTEATDDLYGLDGGSHDIYVDPPNVGVGYLPAGSTANLIKVSTTPNMFWYIMTHNETADGGATVLYLNETKIDSVAETGAWELTCDGSANAFGGWYGNDILFGWFDELYYWNRTFNSTDINDFFHNSSGALTNGTFYPFTTVGGAAAISGDILVNITHPLQNQYLNTNFTINATVNITVDVCNINDTRWNWTSHNASNTTWIFTNTSLLADDFYSINITCVNRTSGLNGSATRDFTIDRIVPNINFSFPTTISGSYAQDWITANATSNDTNLNITTIYLYNSAGLVNITNSSNITTFINFTSLPYGTYYLNASAKDTVGYMNWTEVRTIILAEFPVSVNITYPYNNSRYSTTSLGLNWTVTNVTGLNWCGYSLDGAANDTSIYNPNINTTMTTLTDGTHNVSVYCNDTSGNIGVSSVNFTVDTSAPTMTINNGTNGNFFRPDNRTTLSNTSAQSVTFNITFNDALALYGFEVNMSNSSGNHIFNFTNISLSGNEYNWTHTIDLSHTKGGNMTVNITVWDGHTATKIKDMDVKKGLNYLQFDKKIKITAEGSWIADTVKSRDRYSFEFDYPPLITSDNKIFYVESDSKLDYISNSVFNAHFVDWENKKWIDFNGTGGKAKVTKITDYKYMVEINAEGNSVIFNSIGGLNSRSEVYEFIIDNTPPVLTWVTPIVTTDIPANDSLVVKINVIDGYRNLTQFYVYNSTRNLVNNTNMAQAGGGSYTYNVTFYNLTDETYYINATHRDYYNNTGYSSTITLSDNFLDNCSVAEMHSINFSIVNATDNKYLEGVSEFLFAYNRTDGSGENVYKNYSIQMSHGNFSFCISPNETSFTSDISISYVISPISYTYFTSAIQLTNVSQLINLYTQDDPTRVTFRVTDYDETPVEGAYIKVLKWDIGDNSFKTTEILKTDSQGYALGNIILYTIWYKFIVDYEGVTYLITEPEKIFETTRNFRINFETDWYDTYDTSTGISTSLVFNNITNNFKYEWNTHTGAAREGCLKVVRRNITKDTLMVDNCTSSTAGERIYTIDDITATYMATGYLNFNSKPRTIVTNVLDYIGKSAWKIYDTTGGKKLGIFSGFMITLSLAFIGIWSPISSVVLLLLGIIVSSLLGLYQIALGATIILIVMGGLLLWKLSKR